MHQLYISVSLSASVCAGVGLSTAIAGDYFHILTSEAYQDAVTIGEVISRSDSSLVFRPTRVLFGQRLPQKFRVQLPPYQQAEALQSGDAAVLTLQEDKGIYTLTNQPFEVNHLDPTQAKILSGPLRFSDRFKFQWLINSCGSERNYIDDGKTVWLEQRNRKGEKIGENIPIAARKGNEWAAIGNNKPVCPPIKVSLWDRLLQFLTEIVAV